MLQQNNQTSQGQQQGAMSQPPSVITTKDHLYLTDMLSWNLLALKKAHLFSSQCKDPEIIQALDKACKMHQTHYDTILQHLNGQSGSQNMQ